MKRIPAVSEIFCLLFLALSLWGDIQPVRAQVATSLVYVGNQGNFSDANGSVTLYDPIAAEATLDGIPNLNTLVQSIALHDGTGYIMANTSDRIDVVDLASNARIDQITDVPSPRFIAFAGDQKAYVSNLFSETVTILNLEDHSVGDVIGVGQNPEDIAIVAGRAYVANHGFGAGTTLSVIDVATDALIETLDLACDGPRALEVDFDEQLWVFCTGNTVYNDDFTEIIDQTNGRVVILDGATGAEVERIELEDQLGAASGGQDAFYDPSTRQAFAVQGNTILVFDTRTNAALDPIAISGIEAIGAVGYEASSHRIYLGRITGFTTAGFVSIHDRSGAETDRFTTGVAPTSIAFLQSGTPVASGDWGNGTASGFNLHQNYPNPFQTSTTIVFEAPESTAITLKIFNALGQDVATLVEAVLTPGSHRIHWDASGLPAGRYFYRLQTDAYTATRALILAP